MVIGDMGGGARQGGQDEATIQLRLRHMEVQLRQAEAERARSEAEKETLEERVDHLERQSAAAPVQTTQNAAAAQPGAAPARSLVPQYDSFSRLTTEPSIGLYKVTRDGEGGVSVGLD